VATVVMRLNSPTLKVALTEAELGTTGLAVECQVNVARVEASPNYTSIPPTGCTGAVQSPGQDSWALNLTWLDDWSAPAPGGLSKFSYDNTGKVVFFELTPDVADADVKVTGSAFAVSGGIGGTFGDGSAAQSTATWPCLEQPVITTPATV
jgi:hypothetical protein